MKEIFDNDRMEKKRGHSGHTPLSRVLLALFFIAAGSILIAQKTGYLSNDVFHMIFNWQMLLISIGIISLSKREGSTGGIIMILIGGVFLVPEYIDMTVNTRQLLWPAILIGIGFIILFKGLGNWKTKFSSNFTKTDFDDMDRINATHIFGGGDYHISSDNFKGGRVNAIFGGGKYDFRNAKLDSGIQYLEVSMIFGGLELIIPADWDVKVEVDSILGGFSNKSGGYTRSGESPQGQLVIRGTAIFGGGDIKRF